MSQVFVCGHKSPDTDSIAGALSYSYLKRQLGVDACLLYTSDAADE